MANGSHSFDIHCQSIYNLGKVIGYLKDLIYLVGIVTVLAIEKVKAEHIIFSGK